LILHYHATERDDTPFWDYIRTMQIPDSLQDKMDMFKATGHVQNYRYGLFLEPSWVAVYLGQRFIPNSYDQRVNTLDRKAYIEGMRQFKQAVCDAVKRMPPHNDTIHQYCTVGGIENDGLLQSGLYGKRL
jgi:tryptophan halogenase